MDNDNSSGLKHIKKCFNIGIYNDTKNKAKHKTLTGHHWQMLVNQYIILKIDESKERSKHSSWLSNMNYITG